MGPPSFSVRDVGLAETCSVLTDYFSKQGAWQFSWLGMTQNAADSTCQMTKISNC